MMFENSKDCFLLRDALTSATIYIKDKKLQGHSLDEEETTLDIVASTVNSLATNLYGVKDFQELFEKQHNSRLQCHAVIFINLLKSEGIFCPEAKNFYGSVLFDVDCLSWSFYLKLNFSCLWSEYFIESVRQMQPDTLTLVLNKLLEVQCEDELRAYAIHLALQAYIWKSFMLQNLSIVEKFETNSNFSFNFLVPTTPNGENTSASNYFKDSSLFHVLMKELQNLQVTKPQVGNKVVLHGIKTFLKLLNNTNSCERLSICIENLFDLTTHLASCNISDFILESLVKPSQGINYSGYQLMSWEIKEIYLIFLLQNYWRDFIEKLVPSVNKNMDDSFSKFCYRVKLSMEPNSDILYNKIYLNRSDEFKNKYFHFLSVIVKQRYPFASRAAECLFLESSQLDHYLDVIIKSASILEPFEIHRILADEIVHSKSDQNRQKLLKLFLDILSQTSYDVYNLALENILTKWGDCAVFKSSDFDEQFSQLARSTLDQQKVKTLLSLFVQSPTQTLKLLIDQALKSCAGRKEILEVLKTIPVVCVLPDAPLIKVLSSYFESNLSFDEIKQFPLLLKAIMEIQVTEDILSFDLFLDMCIFPNLQLLDIKLLLKFTLECLHVTSEILIGQHALEVKTEKYIALLKHLGTVLNLSIEEKLGNLKDIVLPLLELLMKYEKRPSLDAILKKESGSDENLFGDHEDIVKLYFLEIFTKTSNSEEQVSSDILEWKNKLIQENFEYVWIWSIISSDIEDFTNKISSFDISYVNIQKILPSLLWHSTKSELLLATELIMRYQKLLKINISDYPWLLPDNDPELYSAFRCLLDSTTIMMKKKSKEDLSHFSCNLINTIMSFIDKPNICPNLLVNIFLDICCLVTSVDYNLISVFTSVLFSVMKRCLQCDTALKVDYVALMKLGLKNIKNDKIDKEKFVEQFCQIKE